MVIREKKKSVKLVTLQVFSLTVFLDGYVGKTAACIVCTFRGRCRSPLELGPSEDFGPRGPPKLGR